MKHRSSIMPTTAIDRMRVRYLSELTTAEARMNAIRAKLQVLDELSAEEKQIGNTADATVSGDSSAGNPKVGVLPSGLTDACRFIVDQFGTTRAMTTRNVIDQLAAHGYGPNAKNFTGIVMVTLKRLAKNGRILVEKNKKKWVFRANPAKPFL